MKMLSVRNENGRIYVKCEYNAVFVSKVKLIGGKWHAEKKEWSVNDSKKEALDIILFDIFGFREGLPLQVVQVEYVADDFEVRCEDICIGGLIMASRKRRDGEVSLFYNTYVVEGGFPERGGSSKYPAPDPEEGTILRSVIPITVYDKLTEEEKSKLKVIVSKSDKEELLKEKEMLLKRLGEIEQLLKNY